VMLHLGWLPQQASHAFNDVLTPVFDRVLVIVIASDILKSVEFSLPESLMIWHANKVVLDAISICEAWETRSGGSYVQPVVIEQLHAPLIDPTVGIVVLCAHYKRAEGFVL